MPSDRAILTEYFVRHGNYLTAVSIVDDPIYLTEPFVRTSNWVANTTPESMVDAPAAPSFCGPAHIVEEIAGRPEGYVPHYLPDQNPFLEEYPKKSGIPREALRGGAQTTLPEYQFTLQSLSPRK